MFKTIKIFLAIAVIFAFLSFSFFFIVGGQPYGPLVAAYENTSKNKVSYERDMQKQFVKKFGGSPSDWKLESYHCEFQDLHNGTLTNVTWKHIPTGVVYLGEESHDGHTPDNFEGVFEDKLIESNDTYFETIRKIFSENIPSKNVKIGLNRTKNYYVDHDVTDNEDSIFVNIHELRKPTIAMCYVLEVDINSTDYKKEEIDRPLKQTAAAIQELIKRKSEVGEYAQISVTIQDKDGEEHRIETEKQTGIPNDYFFFDADWNSAQCEYIPYLYNLDLEKVRPGTMVTFDESYYIPVKGY